MKTTFAIYQNIDWAIFPCKRNSKKPATSHGLKDASKDPDQHVKWWNSAEALNIAVRTGKESGIFVLDIDIKGDRNGFEWLKEQEGRLPHTLTARTPSGGLHYYFKFPEDRVLRNSAGKLAPGVDIRGDNGYVLVPPSELANGNYEWIDQDSKIAEAPQWLLDEITDSEAPKARQSKANSQGLDGFTEGERDDGIFNYALTRFGKGLTYEEAKKLVLQKAQNCSPPFNAEEALKCLESAYGYVNHVRRPLTELGNAERLRDRYGDIIRYIPEYDCWIVWNGRNWIVSHLGEIHQLAAIVVRNIPNEVADVSDEDLISKHRKFAKDSEKRSALDNMIRLAQKLQGLSIHADQLDADDALFGVLNGVIDLHTGGFREAQPQDFVTMQGLVTYDPAASCPRWLQFIAEITDGDEEASAFLKRLAGSTLLGGNPEQIFVILHGYGGNGKSTFVETLQEVQGAYARVADSSLFLDAKWIGTGGPREDIVRLKGKRLVLTTEVGEGHFLNEDLVKKMTGGDTLVGRMPYGRNSIEFRPRFTPIMSTNHEPIVRGNDHAIWRRIILVPFRKTFKGEERDRALRETLEEEASGILNWMIEGCLEYQRIGLRPPKSVVKASEAYRTDMDILGEWIDEDCEIGPTLKAANDELYWSYQASARDSNLKPYSKNVFGRKLKERGFEPIKINGRRGYRGIRVKDSKAALHPKAS